MKKVVSVVEVEGEGLMALLNQNVLLLCSNYFYAGKLVGVNDSVVQLEDAVIVYETGNLDANKWQDAQKLPGTCWYVQTNSIESFGVSGR